MQTNFKVGNLIYEKRKEKGWSQKQLGEALGVSNKAVSKWEVGSSMPDQGLLVPLAKVLGITVEELLTGEEQTRNTLTKEEVLQSLRYLNKEIILFLMMCSVFVLYGLLLLVMNQWGWEGNQPYNHSFYLTMRIFVPISLYILFVLLSTIISVLEVKRYNLYNKRTLIVFFLMIFFSSLFIYIPRMIKYIVMRRIYILSKKTSA